MPLAMFNVLLMTLGLFLVVGVTALPALLQWPVPASAVRGRNGRFAGTRVAFGGGWS